MDEKNPVATPDFHSFALNFVAEKIKVLDDKAFVVAKKFKNGDYTRYRYYVHYPGRDTFRFASLRDLVMTMGASYQTLRQIWQSQLDVYKRREWNSLMLVALRMRVKMNKQEMAYILNIGIRKYGQLESKNPALPLPRSLAIRLDLLDRFESIARLHQSSERRASQALLP